MPSSEIEPGALSGSREEIRVSTNQFRKQDKDIYRNKTMKGPRQREASQPATDPNLRLAAEKG